MRYWWVNQNQTFRYEVEGGYLWSPKTNKNGARNPFYESMREVAPGDLILSFSDTRIAAIGIARTYCYESPKPIEFGNAGLYWNKVGWRVRVGFQRLQNQVRLKDNIEFLRPFLPERYSPLQANGNGIQSVYLTGLSPELFGAIALLIGSEANQIWQMAENQPLQDRQAVAADMEIWEHHLEDEVEHNTSIDSNRTRGNHHRPKGARAFPGQGVAVRAILPSNESRQPRAPASESRETVARL